ncbi:MAG: zinc ribbon domain-containing protein [Candidatus Methanoplasma sp.]|jgi:predicted nucleic acid-binding Zn ribbon protein|nr:zinc ribbon domain-containing protein [Candidatus Methanoplasma sp.]
MRYICPECGGEIPEDNDFCFQCGRTRDNTIRLDESGNFIQPEKNMCASCGAELSSDDLFCPACGEARSRIQMAAFKPQMVKYGWIGLALAFIPGALGFVPGFAGIFGLGHLYFRKWGRGVLYLSVSAFIFYIRYINDDTSLIQDILYITVTAFFYIIQGMEVLVLAYMPPKNPK